MHEHLALLALGNAQLEYRQSPWMEFVDRSGRRWCQLDGLLINSLAPAACIYEVKYKHTADAWWQLTQLYLPVVRVALPAIRLISLCEIVHWHDPQVDFPQRYDLTDSPLRIPHAHRIAVCIFNPKNPNRLLTHGGDERKGAGQTASPIGHETGTERFTRPA